MKTRTTCRPVEALSLANEHIELFEVTTLNTAYCFARQKTDSTCLARWHVLNGRPEIVGKTVHLFGINEDGELQEVTSGGRLAIYCFSDQDALPWHTSKILSLAVATGSRL